MYVCENCKIQQVAGTPQKRVVINARVCQHPFRSGKPLVKNGPSPIKCYRWEWEKGKGWKWKWHNDPGGTGPQITKEMKICPGCQIKI